MTQKCQRCGLILRDDYTSTCPNCSSRDIIQSIEDNAWYNRYASEKMTREEAVEFFETDKY